MPLKMSSEKWWHSCLGLNVLMSVNWAQLTPLLELTSPLSVAIDIFVVNLDTHVRLPCINSTEPWELYMLLGQMEEEAWPDPQPLPLVSK